MATHSQVPEAASRIGKDHIKSDANQDVLKPRSHVGTSYRRVHDIFEATATEPVITININNTVRGGDDLVRLQSTTPPRKFIVPCQISAAGGEGDVEVTLSSGGDRLGFSTSADAVTTNTTIDIKLQKDGSASPVSFYVVGNKVSDDTDDAKINVVDKATKVNLLKKECTVFSFTSPTMELTPGGAYSTHPTIIQGSPKTLYSPDTVAMKMAATVKIVPNTLSLQSNVLRLLRLGIVQNGFARTVTIKYTPAIVWDNPAVNPNVKAGLFISVYPSYQSSVTVPDKAVSDAVTPADEPFMYRTSPLGLDGKPIVDKKTKNPIESGLVTLDLPTTSEDSPVVAYSPTILTIRAVDPEGHEVGTLSYVLTEITLKTKFEDWCTIADTQGSVKGQTEWLKHDGWSLDISSANNVPQIATIGGEKKEIPVEDGKTANELLAASPVIHPAHDGPQDHVIAYPATL